MCGVPRFALGGEGGHSSRTKTCRPTSLNHSPSLDVRFFGPAQRAGLKNFAPPEWALFGINVSKMPKSFAQKRQKDCLTFLGVPCRVGGGPETLSGPGGGAPLLHPVHPPHTEPFGVGCENISALDSVHGPGVGPKSKKLISRPSWKFEREAKMNTTGTPRQRRRRRFPHHGPQK